LHICVQWQWQLPCETPPPPDEIYASGVGGGLLVVLINTPHLFYSDWRSVLLLLSVVTSGAVPMSVDNVDADLGQQLSKVAELWSDMIIFSFVMPSKFWSSSFNCMLNLHTVSADIGLRLLAKIFV